MIVMMQSKQDPVSWFLSVFFFSSQLPRCCYAEIRVADIHPTNRLRLREEVDILKHLSQAALSHSDGRHPNVLGYIDSWEEAEALYIRTELCEYGNLARFLWEYGRVYPRLDEARVWKVIADLSSVSSTCFSGYGSATPIVRISGGGVQPCKSVGRRYDLMSHLVGHISHAELVCRVLRSSMPRV